MKRLPEGWRRKLEDVGFGLFSGAFIALVFYLFFLHMRMGWRFI